jgi:hypothetical protein
MNRVKFLCLLVALVLSSFIVGKPQQQASASQAIDFERDIKADGRLAF